MARVDAWENGEKWNDPDFVRSELIRLKLNDHIAELQADDEDFSYPEGEEWKRLYADAAVEADAVPVEQRVEMLKTAQHEAESELLHTELAGHHADRIAMTQGLADDDDRRDGLYDEQLERVQGLSAEELAAEKAKMEAWEDAKWNDPATTRDELIYTTRDKR